MAGKQKKTSGKNNARPRIRSSLRTQDIKRFKQMLLEKRNELLGNVEEITGDTLKRSPSNATGDLSAVPIHMADIGSDNYEQQFALELMESERKLLRKVDDALKRIDIGIYGICQATGKPISRARLEAKPWARYCIEYARALEQGLATEPQ
ncbi:MAG: TraR/DksA C4-type zinc finger protein [Phycisphaerales bacterium]|jgi:RNA polymerase-binding protein DksA